MDGSERHILRAVLLALLLAATPALPAQEAVTAPRPAAATFAPAISEADVRPHIEYLAGPELLGRSGATSPIAAEYVISHFKALGLEPLFAEGSYRQPIPGAATPDGQATVIGHNIGALLRGSDPTLADEYIIISAHYDHLGVRGGEVYAGADDNASGVSMVLEVARQLATQETRPRRSVAFVGFDLEERMLWGSRWFAAHPPWPLEQLKLFITADMIGRSLGGLPLPAVFVLGSESAPELKAMLNAVGEPDGLEVARLGVDLIGTRSDYGPFRDREIPFLFFSTGEHPDYHTPRDLPERIDYGKVARVSSLVLELARTAGDTDDAPQWTSARDPDLDEARAMNRITNLLLKAEKERPLSDLQRFMVVQVRTKTRQILERDVMTADERTWLIRMSQLLLLSVF